MHSPRDLEALGSVNAYRLLKQHGYPVSLNLVYAIEGALRGMDWNRLPLALKTELKVRIAPDENQDFVVTFGWGGEPMHAAGFVEAALAGRSANQVLATELVESAEVIALIPCTCRRSMRRCWLRGRGHGDANLGHDISGQLARRRDQLRWRGVQQ